MLFRSKVLVDSMVDEAVNSNVDWSSPAAFPFALAVWCRGFAKRTPVPKTLHSVFDEAARRVDTCRNTTDTLAVAEWVFSQLQIPPSDASDQPESGDQGDGEGEDTPGEQTSQSGDQPGDQDADQPGDQTDDPDQPSGVPAENDQAIDVEPELKPTKQGGKQRVFDKSDLKVAERHQHDNSVPIQPLTNGKLRYEIRRLFENSGYDDWSINKRSGTLNVKALHRVNESTRVFKRHQEVEGIDSAVVILVDVSSSMIHRMDETRSAAAALYQTLSAAGVAVAVVAFDDYATVLKRMQVQRWADFARAVKQGASAARLAATVLDRFERRTKSGSKMGIVTLSDPSGQYEAIMFQEGLNQYRDMLEKGAPDRKSTRLNSSHIPLSRMPSSA